MLPTANEKEREWDTGNCGKRRGEVVGISKHYRYHLVSFFFTLERLRSFGLTNNVVCEFSSGAGVECVIPCLSVVIQQSESGLLVCNVCVSVSIALIYAVLGLARCYVPCDQFSLMGSKAG